MPPVEGDDDGGRTADGDEQTGGITAGTGCWQRDRGSGSLKFDRLMNDKVGDGFKSA